MKISLIRPADKSETQWVLREIATKIMIPIEWRCDMKMSTFPHKKMQNIVYLLWLVFDFVFFSKAINYALEMRRRCFCALLNSCYEYAAALRCLARKKLI